MRWPELDDLAKFPAFVNDVAAFVGIRLLPYVDIGPNTPETEALRRDPRLAAWLAPCADKIRCYIGGEH